MKLSPLSLVVAGATLSAVLAHAQSSSAVSSAFTEPQSPGAQAQVSPGTLAGDLSLKASRRVVERGPHFRVHETVVAEQSGSREGRLQTNRYTELATGMHVFDGAQWVEASDEIEITPEGAKGVKTQHQVHFRGNFLDPEGAVTITTPQGEVLRTKVLGISYQDASGNAVWIAEAKDSNGELLPSNNEVCFRDSFEGIKATTLYVNRIHGIEQFVIFHEQLPPPSDWGLDPETTVVQLITEFLDKPAPQAKARIGALGYDEDLRFSGMAMGKGVAFALGGEKRKILVSKQMLDLEGHTCLVEQVPFQGALPLLEDLPAEDGSAALTAKRRSVLAKHPLSLPAKRSAKTSPTPVKLAKAELPGEGFVLDYSLLTTQDSITLGAVDFYYLVGTVNVNTLTVEANAVVKVTNSPSATIIAGNVIWKTSRYCPAVFSAKDDNTLGDKMTPLPGSTGNPAARYYGGVFLDMSSMQNPVVSNARFCYLSNAVAGSDITFENVQFLRCYRAVAPGASSATLRNVLIERVHTFLGGNGIGGDVVRGENVTAHYCTNFIADATSRQSYLTNCLFVCVTNWSGGGATTDHSAFLDSDAGVFSTVGSGRHYLTEASPYRNAGTAAINEGLLGELRFRTTYPPLVYSNITISVDTTFTPQAQRDLDEIDLGWHYAPLDHVFGGVTASANLRFTPGTACGWFHNSSGWYHAGHGITLGDNKTAVFDGRADAPCYWVRYNTSQEGGPGTWGGGYGPGGITGWASSFALAPTVEARFLRCSVLGGEGGAGSHFRDDYGFMKVRSRDSEYWGGALGGYASCHYHTNALFMRTWVWMEDGQVGGEYIFENCTFYGAPLGINRYSGKRALVVVRNCALDETRFSTRDLYYTDTTISVYEWNAFSTNVFGLTNVFGTDYLLVGSFDWQAGPLGGFYLPPDSPLIDAGPTLASSRGLYHFTTQTSQSKEYDSTVDYGYHYVALDWDKLYDSDWDGVPDYLEDANGNGVVDSNETDWYSASDTGLKVKILRPRQQSSLP